MLGTETNSFISAKDKNILHNKLLVFFQRRIDQFGNTIICTVSQLETVHLVSFEECIILNY